MSGDQEDYLERLITQTRGWRAFLEPCRLAYRIRDEGRPCKSLPDRSHRVSP